MSTADAVRRAGPGRSVLIETKLHAPEPPVGAVERLALLDRLSSSAARLTLVSAPPGWGKSTLLAAWVSRERRFDVAWLSLDDGDDDPVRFWSYLATAVARATGSPDFVTELLARPAVDVALDVLPVMLNGWAELDRPVLLVLDDAHLLRSAGLYRDLGFLIERLPAGFRIAIATRSDPPLPLARLRARGLLQEVRTAELAFTGRETDQLFNDVLRLGLERSAVEQLHGRTEGWAAALQLAALSMRDRPAVEVLRDFHGDHRHVVDYLGAEVLAAQPPALRRFLLQTSVVNRLCASLGDALTGEGGSAGLLEEAARANLFLIPLDDRRRWYRYHHLFQELLVAELRREDPDALPDLHRRASAWFGEHGDSADAIEHALLGEDHRRATTLVAGSWTSYFNHGRLATVDRWLQALPDAAWLREPELALSRVWIAMDTGNLAEVDGWIEATEALGTVPADVTTLLRSLHRFKAGDVAGSARELGPVTEPVGPEASRMSPFYRTVAACLRGLLAYWAGNQDLDAARRAFDRAAALARADENELGELYALGYLARLAVLEGDGERAERLLRRAESLLATGTGSDVHFVAMAVHLARALESERRSDAATARKRAWQALHLARGGAGRVELLGTLAVVARAEANVGETVAARRLLREAEALEERCVDPGRGAAELDAVRRRLSAHTPAVPVQRGAPLSERELSILRLLPGRPSVRDLAAALYLSPNTVKTHLRTIYRKLGAETRDDAVLRGREAGLL